MDCLITHPSIIRAVLDYVCIALKGTGKIIVGDAPLQTCDFTELLRKNGLGDVIDFYRKKNIDIELKDFRKTSSTRVSKSVMKVTQLSGDSLGYTEVDLGMHSMHVPNDREAGRYRVTNYDPRKMKEYHHEGIHKYTVSNSILNADVVINLPKPKTHRKAGITGALKNLVGINGDKDCLPHHKTGSIIEGGDEYLNKCWRKKLSVMLQERMDVYNTEGRYFKTRVIRFWQKGINASLRLKKKDFFREGSWYGNDTIWRTLCDLNRILIYCDKKGHLQNVPQRRMFILTDMVISGEGEGPLMPMPRESGVLIGGCDPLKIDAIVATIMGFDIHKIPSIINAFNIEDYPISKAHLEEIFIESNFDKWNKINILNLPYRDTLKFLASSGWKGHIELKED